MCKHRSHGWGLLVLLLFAAGPVARVAGQPALGQPNDRGVAEAAPEEAEQRDAEQAAPSETEADDSATADADDSATAQIRQAYAKSRSLETAQDCTELIQLLDQAIRGGALTEANTRYARHLKGWVHNRYGELLDKRGRIHAAMIHFETAVRMNPKHWKARYNRGVSYAVDEQLDKAIADLSRAIQLNGGYALAWYNRGEAYYVRGQLREALRDYSEAIRLKPENAMFYHVRGHAHHRLNRYREAMQDYDRSIELDPDAAAPYVYRGDAYVEQGEYARAAQDYRRAVSLNEELGRAYQSIAWLMATCPDEQFRDAKRAVAAAEKAIRLDGDGDHRYVETLAAAHASAGNFAEAQRLQKKVIEMAPEAVAEGCRARLREYERDRPFRQTPRTARETWGPRRTN